MSARARAHTQRQQLKRELQQWEKKNKNEMNREIIAMKKTRTERRNENHRLTIKHPNYLLFFSFLLTHQANGQRFLCVSESQWIRFLFLCVCSTKKKKWTKMTNNDNFETENQWRYSGTRFYSRRCLSNTERRSQRSKNYFSRFLFSFYSNVVCDKRLSKYENDIPPSTVFWPSPNF